MPAQAAARSELASPLAAYAEGRIAAERGAFDRANSAYAIALAALPADVDLASEALSNGIAGGDFALAMEAARKLAAAGDLSVEARLMLTAGALRAGDWRGAGAQLDALEEEESFAFMAPILRAWIAVGARRGNAEALLDGAAAHPIAVSYAAEHRPLLRLALRRRGAAAELAAQAAEAGERGTRFRLAGAALLAGRGDRRGAIELLAGQDRRIVAARALVEAGRPLPGEVATPAAGAAEFLLSMASDLREQNVLPLALSFARIATFLAPDNGAAWLTAADALAGQQRYEAALELLARIPAGDPWADMAAEGRVVILAAAGRGEEALAEALVRDPETVAAWVRIGDIKMELGRQGEAADAYGRALALHGPEDPFPAWALWLARGGALERAGSWAEGKAALTRAYELAPEQAIVLNHLGYAQLERRENLEEAERMVREAARLAPDNAAIADSLGWAYYLKGDIARAVELLERAAEGEPADPTINEHLGDVYWSAGRRIEARFAWRAAAVYAEPEDAERIAAKIAEGLTPRLAAR
ncbi:MAG: tetratricopeptide repeat protein [Allosphingosinicella sp.]|uniref:tetratricopeptide repeat protein n=1 Tax=Allosphingosinicella sp. TaxID=2823234 RepID=UPI003954AEC1